MPTLYVRRVVEPANQELASTATPESIHNNNTDIIETDESTTVAYDMPLAHSTCSDTSIMQDHTS